MVIISEQAVGSGSGVDSTASKLSIHRICFVGSNLMRNFCPSSGQLDKVFSFIFFFP